MRYFLLFLICSYSLLSQFEDAPVYQPTNLDIENSAVGFLPTNWNLPDESEQKGYSAKATNVNPQSGKYCLELEFAQDSAYFDGIHGSALQVFDASPYQGKRIKISGYVRAKVSGADYAGLYVSERNFANEYPFIYANQDSPVQSEDWTFCTTEFDVTNNAYSINMGLILYGRGVAWLDNVTIEIVNQVEKTDISSNLSEEKKQNLLNFTKIYGLTKYYHPSDEVEDHNQETFLYHSIKNILNSNSDIITVYNNRLQKIAPSAYLDNNENNKTLVKPSNAIDRVSIAKVTSNVYFENGNLNSGTKRLNIYSSRMPREASIYQIINAKNFIGKKIKYKAYAKTLPFGEDLHGELWFRVDFEDQAKESINKKMETLIVSRDWKQYSMEIDIPKDAKQIRTGLVMIGEGSILFDSVSIEMTDGKSTLEFPTKNNSFDMKWQPNNIEYWKTPNSSISSGYSYTINNTKNSYDGSSLEMATQKEEYINVPNEGDICNKKIDDNLYLHLPLTVYYDGTTTIPKYTGEEDSPITLNPHDKISQIAVFSEMWNLLRTFSTINLNDDKWDRLYKDNLDKILKTNGAEEFSALMVEFLKVTDNVRADFWLVKKSFDFTLPIVLGFDNDEIEVIKSYDKQLQVGDKLIAIGGVNLNKYIGDRIDRLPGENKIWKQKKIVFPLLLGDFKSEETLKISRNGETLDVKVARNLTNREVFLNRPYTIEWLDSNTIYVDATRLNDFEFSKLMEEFYPAKGIIFDLRGEAMMSEHFLGFFMPNDIPSYKWKLNKYTNPCVEPSTNIIDGKVIAKQSNLTNNVVFITNESTVGRSEIILDLVKKFKIGKIIGQETVGSLETMQEMHLPALFNCSLEIYSMTHSDGSVIGNKGIAPDVIIDSNTDYPDDKKIIKAVELLKEKY